MDGRGTLAAALPWLGLALVALLIYLIPGAASVLEWRREAIADGQLWRLISGHWTHYTPGHLGWDAAALVVLGTALAGRDRRRLVATLVLAQLVIAVGIWWWHPELTRYRGLSGIDAALFCYLATDLSRRTRNPTAAALILLFWAKVGYEAWTGNCLFVTQQGFVSLPSAHLLGGLTGMIAALLPYSRPQFRSESGRQDMAIRLPSASRRATSS